MNTIWNLYNQIKKKSAKFNSKFWTKNLLLQFSDVSHSPMSVPSDARVLSPDPAAIVTTGRTLNCIGLLIDGEDAECTRWRLYDDITDTTVSIPFFFINLKQLNLRLWIFFFTANAFILARTPPRWAWTWSKVTVCRRRT